MHPSDLSALALNCTLKPSPEPSSGDLMVSQFHAALRGHGLRTSSVRVVDHNVAPGVETDMGADDAWPRIREQVLAADVLVFVSDLDGAHVERGTARARTPRRRQWCRRRRRFTPAVERPRRWAWWETRTVRTRSSQTPPGAQRCGFHSPCTGGHILERGSDAQDRLSRSRRAARRGDSRAGNSRRQWRPPGQDAS